MYTWNIKILSGSAFNLRATIMSLQITFLAKLPTLLLCTIIVMSLLAFRFSSMKIDLQLIKSVKCSGAQPASFSEYPSYEVVLISKSLVRPTSRCRRTESIVSLERGVCSCAKLQVFSCYRGWKEACQATRAITTTSRRELSSSFFSSKARRRKKFTSFWQKH